MSRLLLRAYGSLCLRPSVPLSVALPLVIRCLLIPPLMLAFAGCGGDDSTKPPAGDTTPPGPVQNLTVTSPPGRLLSLSWSAPGEDGLRGQATVYSIRYSSTPLTAERWDSAAAVPHPPTPRAAGELERFDVSGMPLGSWSIALKTADEVPNWSELSNVVSVTIADLVAPGTVTNLLVLATGLHSVTLSWRAPGNDGASGTAAAYDIRYAMTGITEETWAAATPVADPPAPMSAGSTEELTIDGLETEQTYFFALKVTDESGNWSELSNVATGTAEDVTPPAMVADLAGCSPGEGSVKLSWTAPGNDNATGQASEYEVRTSLDFIFETNWNAATLVPGVPQPQAAGMAESFTVTGLEAGLTYYFALKTVDASGNWATRSNVTRGMPGSATLRRLTYGPDSGLGAMYPTWSPAGDSIAFAADWSGGYNTELYKLPVACGCVVRLTNHPGDDASPAWSPDGTKIAFTSNTAWVADDALWMMGTAPGSPRVRLTEFSGRILRDCRWSPDGTQIAYEGYSMEPPAVASVYVVSAQGGEPRKLTGNGSFDGTPSWSPDGSRIAFWSSRSGTNQIWIMPAAGGEAVPFTTEPGSALYPAWSPDGSRIAFVSNRTGAQQIWVMPAEGGEAMQLTLSPYSPYGPVWSPDGTRIAYSIYREGRHDVWILDVE